MKKIIISCCFFIFGIGISHAQYFKTEDFEIQQNTSAVEHEERKLHFPATEYTKAEEDSLRALFSEENFKKKKPETKKLLDTGYLYNPKNSNWNIRKEEV